MKGNNLLLGLAVIAVIFSIIAAGLTFSSIDNLSSRITALAGGLSGTINLTIPTMVAINFTNNAVNFSFGQVTTGFGAAYLITTGSTGTVTNGNWTAQTGLIIENIGNVNISLNLSGQKTAAAFIGGTSPIYRWNVTGTGCLNSTGDGEAGLLKHIFYNVNTTSGFQPCTVLRYEAAVDEVRIDFNLTIPEDSKTGALIDTITATVVANNPS